MHQQFYKHMKQIVCQYGSKKCLYLHQTSFTTLCHNIKIDFEDAPSVFQLMYIDEEAADWMIIENQKDLDKILSLNKKYALIKILPFVDRNEPNLSHTNIGKFRMTQDFRKMVQFVSKRHTQRYDEKSKTERMIRDSGMMLEQKIPPSLTKFDALPPNVSANLARKKDKTDKVSRISPQKKSIEKSIQNAVKCKFNKIIGQVIESSYESILKNRYCADCSSKQLQLERLITRELLKKIKKYQINPEE